MTRSPFQPTRARDGAANAGLPRLSDQLDAIGQRLAAIGAVGVVMLDTAALEGIEWDYGPAAYERRIAGWGPRQGAPRLVLNHDPSGFFESLR